MSTPSLLSPDKFKEFTSRASSPSPAKHDAPSNAVASGTSVLSAEAALFIKFDTSDRNEVLNFLATTYKGSLSSMSSESSRSSLGSRAS